MKRLLLTLAGAGACCILAGCAAESRTMEARQDAVEGLPGITAYYETATEHHRRAVRKPIRDKRARALRMLAQKTEALIAETEDWDGNARLVSIEETSRPAAREAVAHFRASLQDLHTASANADIAAVRLHYARALASYRHVDDVLEPDK